MLINKYINMILVWLLAVSVSWAQFSNPFTVSAKLEGKEVVVSVTVPEHHHLYYKDFKVMDGAGAELEEVQLPELVTIKDPFTGDSKKAFSESFEAIYAWAPTLGGEDQIVIKYQGCNDLTCFMPQTLKVNVKAEAEFTKLEFGEEAVDFSGEKPEWAVVADFFKVGGQIVGYSAADDFIQFVGESVGAVDRQELSGFRLFLKDPETFVKQSGLFVTLLFILIGGLALNLTPCVLPMIPINLAIIGAGAQAGSKRRGFALGAAYGLGIALVYGLLGLVVVLTGSQFGAIQSSGWFNLVIAFIFVVLALAMFDLFHIDFSRFQGKFSGGGEKKQGSFGVAISMGSVAALLAGACVAPVVIAVLLLATRLGPGGLVLPFVLGLGMALPWPFAGAGLSFLPKPGKWMEYVKYAFGVGILLFALYYAHLSYQAFRPASMGIGHGDESHLVVDGETNDGLSEALQEALDAGKPVILDFWGSACKSCHAMDATTLKEEAVKEALNRFVFIKYVVDKPADPDTARVLRRFSVQGLPTYVILLPTS